MQENVITSKPVWSRLIHRAMVPGRLSGFALGLTNGTMIGVFIASRQLHHWTLIGVMASVVLAGLTVMFFSAVAEKNATARLAQAIARQAVAESER